jgi:hypothetical protein
MHDRRQRQMCIRDSRFTKRFVQKLTKLDGPRLDVFMEYCKPSYPTLALLNDLELGYFIQQKLIQFNQGR